MKMEFFSQHQPLHADFPNIDHLNGFYPPLQTTHDKITEFSPLGEGFMEEFYDWEWEPQLSLKSKHHCFNEEEFPELVTSFNDFNGFDLPPLDDYFASAVDQKPLNTGTASVICVKQENEVEQELNHQHVLPISSSSGRNYECKKASSLDFEEIKKHFEFPITEAAKRMKTGLTLLKRRCRELNIVRWPHRKINSLTMLIDNLKGMGMENEVAMLEEHKEMLENLPWMELSQEAKKLKRAFFKAQFKRRRRDLAPKP